MSRINKLFMAIAKGTLSQESTTSFKRYIGVAACDILAVNPTKAELQKIYKNTVETEPVYVLPKKEGQDYNAIRVTFIVKVHDKDAKNPDGTPIEAINRISFTVREQFRKNKDGNKLQVIDKYGRTAWVTEEEFKAKAIPTLSNGNKARIDKDYRPVYNGEEELTMFVKAYLGIKDVERWNKDTNEWYEISDADERTACECRFDKVKDWFRGNISEIKESIQMQPTNRVKILFGIRTTDENKQWQDAFTRVFMPATSRSNKKFEKEVKQAQENGAYPNTEFEVAPLHEFEVKVTDFSSAPAASNPFESNPFGAPSAVADDLPFGDSANPWE